MYCTKCGAKLDEDERFCKKCGQAAEKDKKGSEPVPATTKQQPSSCAQSCAWIFIILLLIVFLLALFGGYSQIKSSVGLKIAFWFFGAFFVLIFGWAIFRPRKNKKGGKDFHAKPKGDKTTAVITSVIAIIVIIPIVLVMIYSFKNHDITPTPTPTSTSKPTSTSTSNNGGNTKKTTSYDGNYDAQMSKPNCDSSVEITSFQVAGSEVMNTYGNNAPIDSSGHATLTYDTSTSMTVNFTFTSSGASGTWSTSKGCSGTFTADKSW
jgi:hypothetical protein